MQAAVLLVKLKHLDRWNAARREVATRYDAGVANPRIVRRKASAGEAYIAHLYVIEAESRDELVVYLKSRGIPCDIHYPIPDHQQKRMLDLCSDIQLKRTEEACRKVLTLPCFPEMTKEETDEIITALNGWCEQCAALIIPLV